ncbi:MAG: lipase [Candidatus Kaiserbacteria bacterium]|nr:lipase [Candidatus Kaiserbacteria bacterium]
MFSHNAYTPPAATSIDPVACTMEAKLCPDGSYVGRTGPQCQFTECPTGVATTTPHTIVSVSSLSPTSGVVGSVVTIKGSGFAGDNTVHFGSGVIVHVISKSNTSLTFTVPNGLTPACFYSNPRCMVMTRLTTPGVYPVSVQNSRGTSNVVNFTVTDGSTPEPTTISIQSIIPKSGTVGTVVTLTGRFMSDSNIIHFGSGAIGPVGIDSSIAVACTTDPSCIPGIRQTIHFTVPSSVGPYCQPGMMCPMYLQLVTPGTYKVYVENENGTTNTVTFTVTGPVASGGPLSVTGLDAPASLALGTTGTWTIHVNTNTDAGTLHYSVVWGDETNAATASQIRDPGTVDIQSSATFTHSYQRSGTFTPTFTVVDDAGHSVTTSSTVVVTPLY